MSHRRVAGVEYITNNATHEEWSVETFLKNTAGTCSSCLEEVKSLHQVGEIIDKNTFICKGCLKEPTSLKIVAA